MEQDHEIYETIIYPIKDNMGEYCKLLSMRNTKTGIITMVLRTNNMRSLPQKMTEEHYRKFISDLEYDMRNIFDCENKKIMQKKEYDDLLQAIKNDKRR